MGGSRYPFFLHASWGTPAAAVATLSHSGKPEPPANIVNSLQIGLVPRLHRTASAAGLQRDFKRRVLVLWVLGMITSYTLGGVVHLMLVLALVVIVFQFVSGRRSI